jgi:hypothetical protein
MARVSGAKAVHYPQAETTEKKKAAAVLRAFSFLIAASRGARGLPVPRSRGAAARRGSSAGGGGSWRWVVVALLLAAACLSPLTHAQEDGEDSQSPGSKTSAENNEGGNSGSDDGDDGAPYTAPPPRALSAARRPSFPLHAASAVGGDSGGVELTWTPPLTRRVFPGGGDGNVGSDETVEDGGACLEVYNSSHGGHRTRWGVSLLV